MQTLLRPLVLVSIVLLVPIVPFVVFGEQLETWFHTWSEQQASRRVGGRGRGRTAGHRHRLADTVEYGQHVWRCDSWEHSGARWRRGWG